jgi:hypothetical protein
VDDLSRRTVVTISLVLLLVGAAAAQIEVRVPASSFKQEGRIEARVSNKGALPVSYCVEFGQWSPHAGTIEGTPIPFLVERQSGESWKVLVIGPDIGSSRHSVTLDSGASSEFPFRLNNTGRLRLVLYYWAGERNDVCDESAKGRKTAKSKVFSIVED